MCRSGQWFAFQHHDLLPDVMTLAKALGNGVPIGACVARGDAAQALVPGNHGSTYGGNPLVCRAALATVDTLASQCLYERAAALGDRIVMGFENALANVDGVREVRGLGLLLAIELEEPCTELVPMALERGYRAGNDGPDRATGFIG